MADIIQFPWRYEILFRGSQVESRLAEFYEAQKFGNVETLSACCYANLVVGRYLVDNYMDLYSDIVNQTGILINNPKEHAFLKNFAYYDLIKEYTPDTWESKRFFDLADDKDAPFVVRGSFHSKKKYWNKIMFAETKDRALDVGIELSRHDDIGDRILYRKYIPLNVFGQGFNGIHYANEWRFFFLRRTLVSYGYYWDSAPRGIQDQAGMTQDGIKFAAMIARIISNFCNFFTVDIAETMEGYWTVIDVDDAQEQSLCCIEPAVFYRNLNIELSKYQPSVEPQQFSPAAQRYHLREIPR